MKEVNAPSNRLLTRAEVAKMFQVSPSTVTRWAEAGKLPVVKTLGGHRRYEASTVMNLVNQLTKETNTMEKALIDVPTMYGDHHVLEVRQLLMQLPGVEDVYASSCFKSVEVSFDPSKLDADALKTKLAEAGYLEDVPVPVETMAAPAHVKNGEETFFRHSTAYEHVGQAVSFGQDIKFTGRPLWPCPGMGVIKHTEQEATHA